VRYWPFLDVEHALCDTRAQELLALGITPVEDHSRADERRCRNDKTRRPDEADPLLVRKDLGVALRDGHQLVSGQR
jgi:hypothetical protein